MKRKTITELALLATKEGFNRKEFFQIVILEGYNQEDWASWLSLMAKLKDNF